MPIVSPATAGRQEYDVIVVGSGAAGGFYTTLVGMKDIQYVGNVPLPRFDGPSAEVLRRVGLTKETP